MTDNYLILLIMWIFKRVLTVLSELSLGRNHWMTLIWFSVRLVMTLFLLSLQLKIILNNFKNLYCLPMTLMLFVRNVERFSGKVSQRNLLFLKIEQTKSSYPKSNSISSKKKLVYFDNMFWFSFFTNEREIVNVSSISKINRVPHNCHKRV